MTLKVDGAGSFADGTTMGVFLAFADGIQLQRLWAPNNLIQIYICGATMPLSVWDMDAQLQKAGAIGSLVMLKAYWAASLKHLDDILQELQRLHREPQGSWALAKQYLASTQQELQYLCTSL
jgi:hypothetical protein